MIGIAHPLIALAGQIGLALLTGSWWLGPIASLFFVGREITQAEYRWIANYGLGLRANMPWWGRFDPRVWDIHSITDCALPLFVTVGVALIFGWR